MTKEEIISAFKSIKSKCDKIIDNEHYFAEGFVQDTLGNISDMCDRILDDIAEYVFPPEDKNENSKDYTTKQIIKAAKDYCNSQPGWGNIMDCADKEDCQRDFRAGAEWMARQGQTFEAHVDNGCAIASGVKLPFVLWNTYEDGCVLKVQIRKKK